MQEGTNKSENEKNEVQTKKKLKLTKPHVAMISACATTLVFFLAFSCYGCSYQPVSPPTQEEAKASFEKMYNSTWILDTAEGVPTLPEIGGQTIEKIVIEQKRQDSTSVSASLYIPRNAPILVQLTYQEGYGFLMKTGSTLLPCKILYSVSKDGKSETLTLLGNDSNTHCYYLKK